MSIISDLHLHSKYSRAVSQRMTLEEISSFAAKKGIKLVATADWTHPLWFRSIKEELIETNSGIYTLKKKPGETYFLLTTEISSIYSQAGQTRRIHNLIFSPSIEVCEKIINKLNQYGCNLYTDGRPIIGLSAKKLLKMILEIDEKTLLIPCHVWTPWFSLYGSKSGFNSIEECFEDYSKYIYAIETGLSSDPIMNWQIKELKNRSIVSFSDAHSAQKLGREATVFIAKDQNESMINISYDDIIKAIKQDPNGRLKIGYTIEFFPEEGKYHWSGHRQCQVKLSPLEVKKQDTICPVCKKPLTIGVENRVLDLSEKILQKDDLLFLKNKNGVTFVYDKEKKRIPFVSLVPLLEVLTEINQGSITKAEKEYQWLIENLGSEFEILLKKTLNEIEAVAGKKIKQAIEIVRDRGVFVDPGYDGVFGAVKIFSQKNLNEDRNQPTKEKKQPSLF
ncbi:MAG: endonuclease Q family protein [Patescibacteria group bacterium]|nr:endonuclease Q family protein [Patescibacteria group bacterium]